MRKNNLIFNLKNKIIKHYVTKLINFVVIRTSKLKLKIFKKKFKWNLTKMVIFTVKLSDLNTFQF